MLKTYTLYIFLFFLILISFGVPQNNSIECSICDKQIQEPQYLVDVWGNPFHLAHEREGIFCECCSRIISRKITNGGYQLNDGRYICSLCDVSIIRNEKELNDSFENVQLTLKRMGLDFIDKNEVDIKLISKMSMMEEYRFNNNDHLKGLTKISLNKEKPFQILILDNIPKIQFEAILAHELFHIWLYKKNITLPKSKMEGFCNLGSYIMYKLDDTQFSKIHLMSMENDKTSLDVQTYMILKALMEKNSLKYILNNITTIDIQ